jgi:hypothetical protein
MVEIKNQEFHAPLKFNVAFTPATQVCPTYKSEVSHISQDSNYVIFSE